MIFWGACFLCQIQRCISTMIVTAPLFSLSVLFLAQQYQDGSCNRAGTSQAIKYKYSSLNNSQNLSRFYDFMGNVYFWFLRDEWNVDWFSTNLVFLKKMTFPFLSCPLFMSGERWFFQIAEFQILGTYFFSFQQWGLGDNSRGK